MKALLQTEIFKILKRPRTYIGFGSILLIVLALEFAFFAEGDKILGMAIQNLQNDFRLEGKIINVNFLTYMLLNTLILHIPILICLVTGDIISGESANGSLRLILQRPFSRTKIYFAKWTSGMIYTFLLLIFMISLTYGLGYLLFGNGDLIVIRRGVSVFSEDDVLWRFAAAFGMGVLSMMVVASLSIMISSFVNNSIGPIVGTIAIIIIFNIISTLGVNLIKPALPYFFTTHFIKWQYFFDPNIEWDAINKAIFIQSAYILIFTLVGWYNFKKKDMLI